MKGAGSVAVVLLLSSASYAESLGDAAKRERERREKAKRQQGAQAGTRVIRDEDLVAAPRKDAKGTFSSGTAPVIPPTPTSSSAGPGGGAITEVDAMRTGARQRLEASYARIAEMATSLLDAARQYQHCGEMATHSCQTLLVAIGNLAMLVGAGMEDAEEAARQGWLNPGEVRAMRQRYGMDDARWDGLVRLVHRYRR